MNDYIPKHFEALKNAKFNEQGPVGDSPATWVVDMQLDFGQIDNLPDKQLTRQEVRRICQDTRNNVFYGYICAMSWGAQGRGPNGGVNARKAWAARGQFQDRLENLRGMKNSKRCDAYNLFSGKNRVSGLGSAYFTKLLYFFGPGNHYVMDQWTVKSVCLLTGRKIVKNSGGHPSKDNTGFNYNLFCRVVDDLAQKFGSTGDVIEQKLFSIGSIKKKPRGVWRQYVVDEWEKLQLKRYNQDALEQFLADLQPVSRHLFGRCDVRYAYTL